MHTYIIVYLHTYTCVHVDLRIIKMKRKKICTLKNLRKGFPGGPVVESLSCNVGDVGSIPGRGTRILHAVEQHVLHAEGLCTSAGEPTNR